MSITNSPLSPQFSDEEMLTQLVDEPTLYEPGPNIVNDMKLLFRKFHEVDENGKRPDERQQRFGIAISKRELLEMLEGDNCVALQICFGFLQDDPHDDINTIPKSNILDNATELIFSRIETQTDKAGTTSIDRTNEKYWATSMNIRPTDVDCPPYVTNCKKPVPRA
ncbi:hypothetical protein [Runella sp.]|uniref:hypothetical protein n=1 Tax=Runella sp. TaxID=1960881 RepID=UPI003D112084